MVTVSHWTLVTISLSDVVGFCYLFLNLWRSVFLEAEADGFDHEGHVESELAHGLHSFLVLDHFIRRCSVGD